MKATSLSVNLAGPCNARCPFCVASATWKTDHDDNRFLRQGLLRALRYAAWHDVDTVLITGSGEPTLQRDLVLRVLEQAEEVGIPVSELQTNGLLLARDPGYLDELQAAGLDVVALSVAGVTAESSSRRMGIELDWPALCRSVAQRGLVCRLSLNLTADDGPFLRDELPAFCDGLVALGVHQLTLRQLGVPPRPVESDESRRRMAWVRDNALPPADVAQLHGRVAAEGTLLRTLSYGARVVDYRGLSVCVATCMTETAAPDEIRSLILQPDGHLYHSWNHRGSILT